MRRIRPEEVRAAYEKTGIKPIQDEWVIRDTGQRCGCAMTALMVAAGQSFDDIAERGDPDLRACSVLDLSHSYVAHFIRGFDGFEISKSEQLSEAMRLGHEDGTMACIAVFGRHGR